MRLPETIEDQELVLYYYGESEHAEAIDRALDESPELERRFSDLRRVLDAVVTPEPPARSDLYGHEVWKRVYPRLEADRRDASGNRQLRRLAGWAIAATLLIVVSFWAGRQTADQIDAAIDVALTEQARHRILLVEVADHLERSQFLLLELTHTDPESLDAERLDAARELKAQSRLYRQAAQQSGEGDVAYLLEELEIFLTELGHMGPGAAGDLAAWQQRIDDKNLLFKVRVLGSTIEERTRPTGNPASGGSPTT